MIDSSVGAFPARYASLLNGGPAMSNDLTPALLHRLNQNIMALGCAVEEIVIWINQRGSTDVSNRIEDHLAVITGNADFIAETIAELIAKCEPKEEIDPED